MTLGRASPSSSFGARPLRPVVLRVVLIAHSSRGEPVRPPAASPSAPTPSTPPVTQSCPFGFGTLETFCGRSGAQFAGEVDAAIDRLVQQQPDYFNTSDTNGPSSFKVLKPHEYHVGVVAALQTRGFCAETDDATVVVKNSNIFSETYDILLGTGHIRRGGYRESCNPPSFPVDPPRPSPTCGWRSTASSATPASPRRATARTCCRSDAAAS